MQKGEITPIGKVLRRTGLDELPQLFNILKLDMSFVGPRPLTIEDVVRLGWENEYYHQRWKVRPGLVGLAQLAPICHKKISWFFDLAYVKSHPLSLDFKIICSAIAVPFFGKKKVIGWIYPKYA